jgi:hypothetical protein
MKCKYSPQEPELKYICRTCSFGPIEVGCLFLHIHRDIKRELTPHGWILTECNRYEVQV